MVLLKGSASMKQFSVALLLVAALALPGRAEFLQMDISIFGMD
jgi:hypothetical protein